MIIHDVELERLCREEALIVGWEPDLINPASIDVRLGERLMIEDPKHSNLEILGISKRTKEDPYWLQPGAFVLAETIEIFNMPENVAGQFVLKSSRAREGRATHWLAIWTRAGAAAASHWSCTTFASITRCPYGRGCASAKWFTTGWQAPLSAATPKWGTTTTSPASCPVGRRRKMTGLRRVNAQPLTTALPVMTESYAAERWASVVGFEGFYEVSTFGRVRSSERMIELTNHPTLKRRTIKARILAQQVNVPSKQHNYRRLQVKLWKENRERTFNVARLVAEAFLPNPCAMPLVLHLDDDATNNCIENLQWGDREENVRQAVERGRFPSGPHHHAYVHGRFATKG